METIKKYANHRLVAFLYLFIITILFFKVYDRVFDKKVHLGGDNAGYYIYGKSIAKGAGYVALHDKGQMKANHFPPGYPALIAVTMKTFSGKIDTIKKANGFYLLAALFVLFFLFRALTLNIHLSFVACLLALYNFHLLQYSTIMMSEMSYLLFSAISLLLYIHIDFQKKPYRNLVFIGFVLTTVFTFYIRTLGISLFVSFLLVLLVQKHWKYAAMLAGCFILLVAPWQIRSHSLGGNAYVNRLFMKNPYRPELGKMEFKDWTERVKMNVKRYFTLELNNSILPFETIDYKQAVKQLTQEALEAKEDELEDEASTSSETAAAEKGGTKKAEKKAEPAVAPNTKTEITTTDYLLAFLLLLLMAIGLARLKDHRILIGLYLAGTFAILFLWPEAWFGIRFMLPLIPILILLILNGITELPAIAYGLLKRKEPWVLSIIIPFLVFYPVYGKLDKRVDDLELQAKGIYVNKFKNYFDIATWASKNLDRDAVVCCRKGQLFYLYANRYVTGYKNTLDAEDLIANLHEKGVTHVVLDQLGYASTSRYLYPAIKKYPGKFKVIHQLKNPDTYIMEFNYDLGYTGEWVGQNKTGKGTYRWANGMAYEGDWLNNRRVGQGKFSWPNGQVFNGEWHNDKRNGPGTLQMPDGTSFKGVWKEDVLEGQVQLFDKSGKLVETAQFKNNRKVQ